MKRNSLYLLIFSALITSVVLILPVQRVQAIGPTLEEDPTYQITPGESLVYKVTVNGTKWASAMNDGLHDLYRYNCIDINNTFGEGLFVGWIADRVWFTVELYDDSASSWSDLFGGQVLWLSGYNSTNASIVRGYLAHFNVQSLNYWWPAIPLNRTNLGASLNGHIGIYMWTNYGSPAAWFAQFPSGSGVSGTWEFWNGSHDGKTANSWKWDLTYDKRGILTRMRIFEDGTSGWELGYEWVLQKAGDSTELLLLAAIMSAPSDGFLGLGMELWIIIGVAGAVALIIVIVVAKRK